jgi:hypothetical protein
MLQLDFSHNMTGVVGLKIAGHIPSGEHPTVWLGPRAVSYLLKKLAEAQHGMLSDDPSNKGE